MGIDNREPKFPYSLHSSYMRLQNIIATRKMIAAYNVYEIIKEKQRSLCDVLLHSDKITIISY